MTALRESKRYPLLACLALTVCSAAPAAEAAEGWDTSASQGLSAAAEPALPSSAEDDGLSAYFADWSARVARARASQPSWSSPLVTTTGMLEQRLRFDLAHQHSGNGADTTVLDGGRGLDLIVAENSEIQIASIPYYIRSATPKTSAVSGFADWPFLRFKQRLASSPESEGNYVLSTWLQVQAPAGVRQLTSNAWTYTPTIAFGKGWGDFVVQGTVAGVLPASHTDILGHQVQTNLALQYRVLDIFWPQFEVNWTYYTDGQRGGLNQVYLTPGLVIGRFSLGKDLRFTFGFGYQQAVSPDYRAKPLTPAYDHAWLFTSRLNF